MGDQHNLIKSYLRVGILAVMEARLFPKKTKFPAKEKIEIEYVRRDDEVGVDYFTFKWKHDEADTDFAEGSIADKSLGLEGWRKMNCVVDVCDVKDLEGGGYERDYHFAQVRSGS